MANAIHFSLPVPIRQNPAPGVRPATAAGTIGNPKDRTPTKTPLAPFRHRWHTTAPIVGPGFPPLNVYCMPFPCAIRNFVVCLVFAGLCLLTAGCHLFSVRPPSAPPQPLYVTSADSEFVWERIVDVLHDYPFEIERENKLNGIIETKYRIGSTLLEPWFRDSYGLRNRLESGIQTVRRKVFVTMTPVEGGYIVTVRADKELENFPIAAANTTGGATFQENQPLQRDLNAVLGPETAQEWVRRGRDTVLEQDLTSRLQAVFSR